MRISPLPVFLLILPTLWPTLWLTACAPVNAPPATENVKALHEVDFGKFAVKVMPADRDRQQPVITYTYQPLLLDGAPVDRVETGQVNLGFPREDCSTLTVELIEENRVGYYLLSTCDYSGYAAFIPPSETRLCAPAGLDEIPAFVTEHPFSLYAPPDGHNGETPLLSPDSPRPQRLLLFQDGEWRTDKPGEFQEFYAGLADEIRADRDMNPVDRALLLSYYRLMQDENQTPDTLRDDLPKEHAALAASIFADLRQAVTKFDPVRNMPL